MPNLEVGSFLSSLGLVDVVANLLLALLLSLVNSYVYRKTHSGYAYSVSFNMAMVIIAMVVTMIMMVISNYLALSLGLVGALSVIRFRTAIKDPKDIAYLFLSISVGLACSTSNYVLAITGTLIINATLYVLHSLRYGSTTSSDYCLTFCIDTRGEKHSDDIEKALQGFPKATFRSFAQISEDLGEYVYSVTLADEPHHLVVSRITDELSGISNVSLLAPKSMLEM